MIKKDTINLVMNMVCVLSPVIGFLPQIIRGKVSFSPILSFFAIVSSISRIYCWGSENFDFYIVLQSISIILLHNLLIAMKDNSRLSYYEKRFFKSPFTRKSFREKKLFIVHLQLLILFCINIYMWHCSLPLRWMLAICKYTNFILDTTSGLMQYFLNLYDTKVPSYQKSCEKKTRELFFCWILGDMAKICWLISINSPYTIIGSVFFQLIVNCFLLCQK